MRISSSSSAAALLLPLLLTLGSCGGGGNDPRALNDAGSLALREQRWEAAAESFGAALALLEPSSDQWLRAKRGRLEANAHAEPGKAADELLALAREREVGIDDYYKVAKAMVEEQHVAESRRVLQAAWKVFPDADGTRDENRQLQFLVLDALKALSQGAAGSLGIEGLSDLGYTAGGDTTEQLETAKFKQDLATFLELDSAG